MDPWVKISYKLFVGRGLSFEEKIDLFVHIKSPEYSNEIINCMRRGSMDLITTSIAIELLGIKSEVP